MPQRITPELCEMLKKHHPIWFNTQFNHPNEITKDSERACAMLADAGIPLGNQSVLLRDINDCIHVMKKLVHELVKIRVRPYYIYQCDLSIGLEHFRTTGKPVFHIRRSYRTDGTDVELPRLEQFKQHGFKVVAGTPGAEIVDELKPKPDEYIIIKSRWSGFFKTSLDLLLIRLGIKTVVLTGVQTPNCVRTTAYDAISYDLDTIVVSDCSAALTSEIHQYNLFRRTKFNHNVSNRLHANYGVGNQIKSPKIGQLGSLIDIYV